MPGYLLQILEIHVYFLPGGVSLVFLMNDRGFIQMGTTNTMGNTTKALSVNSPEIQQQSQQGCGTTHQQKRSGPVLKKIVITCKSEHPSN